MKQGVHSISGQERAIALNRSAKEIREMNTNTALETLSLLVNSGLIKKEARKLFVNIKAISDCMCLCQVSPRKFVKLVEMLLVVFDADEIVIALTRDEKHYHFIGKFTVADLHEERDWGNAGQSYKLLPGHEADRPCVCSVIPHFLDLPVSFTFRV